MINTKINYDLYIFNIILISLIVDIGGALHLKDTAFILLAIYLIYKVLMNDSYKHSGVVFYLKQNIFNELKLEIIIFFIFPIIILLLSIIYRDIDPMKAIAQITSYILWLLYPVLMDLKPEVIIIQLKRMLYFCALIVILTFITLYCFHLAGRNDLIEMFNTFSSRYSLGYIGRNPAFHPIFLPNVFFRWTFLLIPGLMLHFDEFNYKTLIFGFAILMTLSTGTILFALLGFIIKLYFMYKSGINKKKIINSAKILVLSIIILSFFIDLELIINPILDKFSSTNSSTAVKLLHIESIIEVLKNDIFKLLMGMGLGSEFYSKAVMDYVVNVEVSYFNLVRQFGIIYSILFFYYVIYLCKMLKSLDKNGKSLSIGLICMFLATGTNPLLISPIFFLILVVCRGYVTSIQINKGCPDG